MLPLEKRLRRNNYLPAVLRTSQENGKTIYYIEFYVKNPTTGELTRRRKKLQNLRKRYKRKGDFMVEVNEMIANINIKLAGGWNPMFVDDNIRLYTKYSEVLQLFLEHKSKEVRPDTMRTYSSFVNIFSAWLDRIAPGSYFSLINKVVAIRFMDHIYTRRKLSETSYNNYLKVARAVFSWALEKCYCKENPFELIKSKREQKKKRILIPVATREKISNYLTSECQPMLCVCQMEYSSLIRPKEIQNIRIKDIDIENKYIIIRSENAKNHNERYATISDPIIDYLQSLHLSRYNPNYYLFGKQKWVPAKEPISAARFRKVWDRMRIDLKLEKAMQLYSLRDTGITELLKSGMDPLTVMQHADHHDLSITTKYAQHADPKLISKIYNNGPSF